VVKLITNYRDKFKNFSSFKLEKFLIAVFAIVVLCLTITGYMLNLILTINYISGGAKWK